MTEEELKQQLEELRRVKYEEFHKELNALCEKYGVTLQVQSQIIIAEKT